jgi:ribosomal-protein-alanine N-acetyltransferase
MTEGLCIRRMTLADVEAVYAIDVQSFSLPWSERSFRYEVTQNVNSRPWVAELTLPGGEKHLAGMLVIWMIVDEAHVGTIAVHPNHRRQQIGAQLLAQGLLSAAGEGAAKAFLEVRQGNQPAQQMYFKFGFTVAGVRAHYYKDTNEDAILMDLDLISEGIIQNLQQALAEGG